MQGALDQARSGGRANLAKEVWAKGGQYSGKELHEAVRDAGGTRQEGGDRQTDSA